MKITRAGSTPSATGPGDHFTGRVRVDARFSGSGEARIGGATVTFEPGARTNWHTHPLGQTLFILSGAGLVQREGEAVQPVRPGDIIFFEPGEKHWHGSAPGIAMSHLAVSEALDGRTVTWMEPVTDEQYGG